MKIGTTIYSSCGKCRKPLLRPAGGVQGTVARKGGYSYCLTCKKSRCGLFYLVSLADTRAITTSLIQMLTCLFVCSRLPVRALLFSALFATNGGHSECFRQYYLQHPMVDLPTSIPTRDLRGRSSMRQSPGPEDPTPLATNQSSSLSDLSSQADSHSMTSVLSSVADTTTAQSPAQSTGHKLVGHPLCSGGVGTFAGRQT